LLNGIWLALVLGSVVYAAFTGRMEAVSQAALEKAKGAVDLVIGLLGPMMFFLGLMRVASEGGLLRAVNRALRPILRRLFPEVPQDHPAMSAMVMNLAANVLGLGNAATPFGLKAMVELDKLNPRPGVASNAMVLFLAINTSSVTLMLPTGTIAVRAAAGSAGPAEIWVPTLLATTCSTLVAVTVCLLLARLPFFRASRYHVTTELAPLSQESKATPPVADLLSPPHEAPSTWTKGGISAVTLALVVAIILYFAKEFEQQSLTELLKEFARVWLLPLLIAALLLIGWGGRARAYQAVVEGAKEGLDVALRILPFLLAILVAVGMFRASGALDLLVRALDPLTSALGIPAEALPMALLRPLSGSGAFGLMGEIISEHGPDSFVGRFVSVLQGSTETVFYVLALYFGAARIRHGRHALAACLSGDVAGLLGTALACRLFFA